jgi:hypothetical protein
MEQRGPPLSTFFFFFHRRTGPAHMGVGLILDLGTDLPSPRASPLSDEARRGFPPPGSSSKRGARATRLLCTLRLKRVVLRERGRRAAAGQGSQSWEVGKNASARGACPLLVGGAIAALVAETTIHPLLCNSVICMFLLLLSSLLI